MSADNFYLIRKDHDHGKPVFVPVMGFASDDEEPTIRGDEPAFPTVGQAFRWASKEYTEYGVQVHEECGDW